MHPHTSALLLAEILPLWCVCMYTCVRVSVYCVCVSHWSVFSILGHSLSYFWKKHYSLELMALSTLVGQ